MEKPREHRSIYEATSACRQRLRECIGIPALMGDEWPRKRLADFNLWASDSGALAKQNASLDQRLAEKQTVHEVVLNHLSLLEGLLARCQKLVSETAADQDGETNLQETFEDVEDIMAQLVRISVAIRRAGMQARLDRADDSFNPERHVELRRHLKFLILLASLDADQKAGGNIDIMLSRESPVVAQRLILANLLRRHRYIYARRRWMKQAAERKPVLGPQPKQEQSARTPSGQPQAPMMPAAVSRNNAMAAPSIITSTVPTAIQGLLQIPQGSQPSMTAPSSTSSKVVYPKPPRTRDGAMFFRCPCCFQTLPVAITKPSRWRKHLGEDIHPYTCILDDCPKPQQLYLTRKEWARHMREEHETAKYWLCAACLEPTRFDLESYFDAHLRTQHGEVVPEDQIPIFVSMSAYTAPPSLVSCPLCPPPLADEEVDPDALLDHAAEHVHSFSLRSLPWAIPEEGEREYLGLGREDLLDGADFFDVASGPDSADRSWSSNSQGSRDADEIESLADLVFQDENPDVPWEPYRGEGDNPHTSPVLGGEKAQGSYSEAVSRNVDLNAPLSDEVEDEVKEGVWGYLFPMDIRHGSRCVVLRKRTTYSNVDTVAQAVPTSGKGARRGQRALIQEEESFEKQKVNSLTSVVYLIGRHPECDIVINDPVVSNRHCLLFNENKDKESIAVLEDLSANGTFVNEAIIGRNNRRELQEGDEIAVLDKARFIFRYPKSRHNSAFLQQYQIIDQLGKGHFAEVHLCVERSTGNRYAVKIFSKTTGLEERSKNKGLQQEIAVLMGVSHPNVQCLKDTFNEPTGVYLVLDLASEGELFNYIVKHQKLSEGECRKLFTQLFQGVKYLHDRNIVHRNIKPENILLVDQDLHVKLADFGLAKIIGEESFTTALCSTPSYAAPEILTDNKQRKYTQAVDIWSLGVVLYICLCGFPPFSDELYSRENPYTLSQQIRKGRFDYPSPYWDSVGDPALDLIDSMLVVDPDRRFTIDQCLSHPWMLADTPGVNDSTNGLVSAVTGLDVNRHGVVRERTLLSSINTVQKR